MNAASDAHLPGAQLPPAAPSAAARAMIERLVAFKTVSRDSNMGLIEWVRDYLHGQGAKTRLTHDATGKKANLFATLGESAKPGLILSGHRPLRGRGGRRQAVRARFRRHEGFHRHRPHTGPEIRGCPQRESS